MRTLTVIALALLIGGIVMWVVDAWASRREPSVTHVEEMNLPQAIWVGLCQVLSAVVPGTSRSMTTIAAGQIVGMDRPSALEFSFLVSIPTMIAATGYSLLKAVHPSAKDVAKAGADALTPLVMTPEHWIVLIIGMAVSFIVAYVVGRMVSSVCAQARVCSVCGVPHPAGIRLADLAAYASVGARFSLVILIEGSNLRIPAELTSERDRAFSAESCWLMGARGSVRLRTHGGTLKPRQQKAACWSVTTGP